MSVTLRKTTDGQPSVNSGIGCRQWLDTYELAVRLNTIYGHKWGDLIYGSLAGNDPRGLYLFLVFEHRYDNTTGALTWQ